MEDLCTVALILYTLYESRGEEEMSDKEAIEVIKSMGLIVDSVTQGKRRTSIYEALTLAIEALEKIETYKNAYRIMSDAFEVMVKGLNDD